MKFPSLFRIPNHTRFNYEPRYYDPVREELDVRVKQIKKEMEREKHLDMRTSMRESFERRKKASRYAGVNQIIVLTLIVGGTAGWLFYGNTALYILALIFPAYIYFRIRGRI
jgi:hypothetical protein